MWIFTEHGFISAVEDKEDPTRLAVRGRDEVSLRSLVVWGAEHFPGQVTDVIEGVGTDYHYRVYASRPAVAGYVASCVNDIAYTNFKSRITTTRGQVFHDALMDVWIAMLRVTPYRVREQERRRNTYVSPRYRPGKKKGRHPRPDDYGWPLDYEPQDAFSAFDEDEPPLGRKSIHDMTDEELAAIDEDDLSEIIERYLG